MKKIFRAAFAASILLVGARGFAQVGDAADVPTLLTGDSDWAYQRTMSLIAFVNNDGTDPGGTTALTLGPLTIAITDNYSLHYGGVINTATQLGPDGVAGAQPDGLGDGETVNDDLPTGFLDTKVYRRTRSAGASLNMVGGGNLVALGLTFGLTLNVTGDSSLGYFTGGPYSGARFDWLAVGDLSVVRDSFGIPRGTVGTASLSGFLAPTINAFSMGFGLALDHGTALPGGSGFEWADFPAVDDWAVAPGEEWSQTVRRQLSGNVFIHAVYSGIASGTIDQALPIDPPAGFDIPMVERLNTLSVTDPGGIIGTYWFHGQAAAPSSDEIYYSPTQRSMTYWTMADRVLINELVDGDTTTINLNNFLSRFVSHGVTPAGIGAVGTAVNGNVTPTVPASVAVNDVLICAIVQDDNVVSTMPAGWTQIQAVNGTVVGALRGSYWWSRVASLPVTNPLVTHTGGNGIIARIAAFRGCITTGNPYEASSIQANASSNNITAPGVTTLGANRLLVWTGFTSDDNTVTAPPGMALAFNSTSTNGNDESVSMAIQFAEAAAATGNRVGVETVNGADPNIGGLLALVPAGDPVNPFSALSLTPPIPVPGGTFTISGTITANAAPNTVEAAIQVPGVAPTTVTFAVPPGGGLFTSPNLTAPLIDDNSPMSLTSGTRDQGSFGITLRRTGDDAAGVHSKVITVRTVATPIPTPTATPVGMVCADLVSLGAPNEDGNVLGNGAGTAGATAATGAIIIGDAAAGTAYRGFLSFDTSVLFAGAVIYTADLYVQRTASAGNASVLGIPFMEVMSGSFGGASALAAADWQAVATAPSAGTLNVPASNGTSSFSSLNASGLAAINPTGRTQIKLRYINASDSDGAADTFTFGAGGEDGTVANRPYLHICYIPGTGPTPTPTASPTPTSTPTPTPSPTATPTASPTPTPNGIVCTTLTSLGVPNEDGWVSGTVGGAGNGNATNAIRVGDLAAANQSYQGVLSFDTSGLPAGNILSANLTVTRTLLTGTGIGGLTLPIMEVKSGFLGVASALANADYADNTGVNGGALTIPAVNGTSATSPLNGTGLTAINRTGRTQIKLRFSGVSQNDGDGTNDYVTLGAGGEDGIVANQPTLQVCIDTLSAPTATPTATATATATATPTPIDTATPTATPVDTATPTATPVDTATPTATPVDTATPTATPVDTATPTATPVNTATPTATPVDTATPTPSSTPNAVKDWALYE